MICESLRGEPGTKVPGTAMHNKNGGLSSPARQIPVSPSIYIRISPKVLQNLLALFLVNHQVDALPTVAALGLALSPVKHPPPAAPVAAPFRGPTLFL